MAYCNPCCCSPCTCTPTCTCGSNTSSASQPAYVCANGYLNDYARCALARYDQVSYDLDTLPNCCCCPGSNCPGCCWQNACCQNTCPSCCQSTGSGSVCPSGPSYLSAVNEAEQTVTSNSSVLFATDRLSSGNCIQHTAGTSAFTLACPGVYLVEYNANVAVATGTNVAVSMALLSGGAVIPGSESASTVGATGQLESLSAATIVTVPCGTTGNISLSNTSAGSVNVTNANIRIVRIL